MADEVRKNTIHFVITEISYDEPYVYFTLRAADGEENEYEVSKNTPLGAVLYDRLQHFQETVRASAVG